MAAAQNDDAISTLNDVINSVCGRQRKQFFSAYFLTTKFHWHSSYAIGDLKSGQKLLPPSGLRNERKALAKWGKGYKLNWKQNTKPALLHNNKLDNGSPLWQIMSINWIVNLIIWLSFILWIKVLKGLINELQSKSYFAIKDHVTDIFTIAMFTRNRFQTDPWRIRSENRIGFAFCSHGTVSEPVRNGSETGSTFCTSNFGCAWIRSGPVLERSRVNRSWSGPVQFQVQSWWKKNLSIQDTDWLQAVRGKTLHALFLAVKFNHAWPISSFLFVLRWPPAIYWSGGTLF